MSRRTSISKLAREILVWSSSMQLVNPFIETFEKSLLYSAYRIRFSRFLTPQTRAFIFLYNEVSAFNAAAEKCVGITLPKFVIFVHGPEAREPSPEELRKIGDIPHYQIDLQKPSSLDEVFEKIAKSLEKGYKLLFIKLNYQGMRVLKWGSFIFSLFSALLSLLLIFMAGTIAISKSSVERRWFANSLLTAGNLTFVMSFVGFYGVKKSGIKEYLKIYSGVLVINSIYKAILLTIYTQMDWYPNVHYMIIPVVCTCIAFELLTSCVILLELNVVKTSGTQNTR